MDSTAGFFQYDESEEANMQRFMSLAAWWLIQWEFASLLAHACVYPRIVYSHFHQFGVRLVGFRSSMNAKHP
jgi:hypothetical protein